MALILNPFSISNDTLSFIARMIISFLKMVTKSRNKSTQCLRREENGFIILLLHDQRRGFYISTVWLDLELRVFRSSPDVVLVSVLCLLNDELSVKEDEAAHDEQSQVHVCLPGTQKHQTTKE